MEETLTAYTWPIGTTVQLCNVPWDAQYNDIVAWDSKANRDEFFKNLDNVSYESSDFSYLPEGEPVTVGLPYSECYKYNYLVVSNPKQPTDKIQEPHAFYFITACERISPAACRLALQLDVVTTRQFGCEFGDMYVDRGHIGMANANAPQSIDELTGELVNEYFCVPEGLDIGSEYQIAGRTCFQLNNYDKSDLPNGEDNVLRNEDVIIIMATTDLLNDAGTITEPKLSTAQGSSSDGLPNGCAVYAVSPRDWITYLSSISDRPWISQGIISLGAFPGKLIEVNNVVYARPNKAKVPFFTVSGVKFDMAAYDIFKFFNNSQYNNLLKLYTFPYTVIEVTTYNGTSLFLKPDKISGKNLELRIESVVVPAIAKVVVTPKGYNTTDGDVESSFDYTPLNPPKTITKQDKAEYVAGDGFNNSLVITDTSQFSVVNNMYMSYLASTARTREYQYQAAGWTNTKSQAAANLSYEQAQMSIANSQANAQLSYNQAIYANDISTQMGYINTGISTAGNFFGNLASMNIGGAIGSLASGATGAMNTAANSQIATSAANTALQQSNNNNALAGRLATQNQQLASYVANGDYQNAIAGIQATVQDAALTQPSQSGMIGGDGFRWAKGYHTLHILWKTISGAALKSVADYFIRYGYAIHRRLNFGKIGLKDMQVMSDYSYWKCTYSYVTDFDGTETEKDVMRGILAKGTTIWSDPAKIGYDGSHNTVNNVKRLSY